MCYGAEHKREKQHLPKFELTLVCWSSLSYKYGPLQLKSAYIVTAGSSLGSGARIKQSSQLEL